MYLEQFYLGCLAHASYMLGSEGVAVVIDPQRDVDIYLEAAREQRLRVCHVIETHLHADFVSGHRELAKRTGATVLLGPGSGATFPHVAVRDGDELRFGRCALKFLETPGHTLESISIVVTDLDRSSRPFAVFTGDTLFVGDVGRPDLSPDHSPQELSSLLYDSLFEKLLTLPDDVGVYPAHGAGSLCGRQMSAERCSTIGRERATNYALQAKTREEFIRLMTADLPSRPEYFQRDVELNRTGAGAIDDLPLPPSLTPDEVLWLQAAGTIVLDTRPTVEFAAGHVPGSIHIALSGQYALWAATLIGLDQHLVLVAEDSEKLREAQVRLARVGIERVVGYLQQGIGGWASAALPFGHIDQTTVQELYGQLAGPPNGLLVLDVRNEPEWRSGHLDMARNIPLGELTRRLEELDWQRVIAVHCRSGYRSSIAASLLRRAGFSAVVNVLGGFEAWQAAQLPYVVSESSGL